MAEAVLSVTLETLRDLLLEEARFLFGVKDQVEEIQVQLKMMNSFLKDADQRQLREERVRTWVTEVRSLAYKAEDVLEMYAVEVASKKGKGNGIKRVLKRLACILSEGKELHKVGEEIANIKSKINNLITSRDAYGIKDLNEGESSREAKQKQRLLRETYGHKVEQNFVGRKDEIRKLVFLITDDKSHHRVICICGMGGLGKTTLATKIFNHGVVRNSFEAFAWVCISQEMQIDKVLQDILKQLGNEMNGDRTALVPELYKVLKEKKCLVVLDDMWKIEDWKILSEAFPMGEAKSKVLLTTRIEEVAQIGFLHKSETFTKEEGWELLRKLTSPEHDKKDNEMESRFESLGKELVRKCGYLPLAISVLGGILRSKKTIEEWKMVNEDVNLYLKKEKGNKEAVHNVLDLSYDELPYYLKPCFLYLGHYREDEIIYAKTLYFLWIAEGLVLSEHQEGEKTMIDVAETYLKEVASRCMVDVKMDEVSITPKVKTCQLHDLLRDLCLAKGKKENFFDVIEFDSKLPIIDLSNERRRLGLYLRKDLVLNMSTPEGKTRFEILEKVKSQHLRTLYVSNANYSRYHFSEDIRYLKKFKLLRVLALVGCEFELPSEISQLIHLRYLSLFNSIVKELPSLVSLPYLQILDLRVHLGVDIYLPNIFWQMKRLKVIYLPFIYHASETLQFNDLKELEILSGVEYLEDRTINLSGLVNLWHFSGEFGDSHALSQVIDQIHSCCRRIKYINIQINEELVGPSLTSEQGSALFRKILLCENLSRLAVDCRIGKFPPYEPQFCQKLTRVYLKNTGIEEDSMEFLEKLPNLRFLSLSSNAFVGKKMICDAKAFPQLRHLELRESPNLEEWRVDEGALPNLSQLWIARCPKLETITDGLNFSALQRFDIHGMPQEFEKKYRELHKREREKSVELQHQND